MVVELFINSLWAQGWCFLLASGARLPGSHEMRHMEVWAKGEGRFCLGTCLTLLPTWLLLLWKYEQYKWAAPAEESSPCEALQASPQSSPMFSSVGCTKDFMWLPCFLAAFIPRAKEDSWPSHPDMQSRLGHVDDPLEEKWVPWKGLHP